MSGIVGAGPSLAAAKFAESSNEYTTAAERRVFPMSQSCIPTTAAARADQSPHSPHVNESGGWHPGQRASRGQHSLSSAAGGAGRRNIASAPGWPAGGA
jgi:hypothetical protein